MAKLKSIILGSIILSVFIIGINTLPSSAYEVSSEDSDIKIDKFQPSSGVKIKSSNLAQAMENATYNATHKGEPQKEVNVNPYGNDGVQQEKKKRDTSTFRWY